MQQHEELTHFAGFDWAKDHHDIIIIDTKGQIAADFRIEHTAAGWRLWRDKIAAWPKLGVAIEPTPGDSAPDFLLTNARKRASVQPSSNSWKAASPCIRSTP